MKKIIGIILSTVFILIYVIALVNAFGIDVVSVSIFLAFVLVVAILLCVHLLTDEN